MLSKQIWSKLAEPVVLLVVVLGAWMWYLRPEDAPAWAAGMFFLPTAWAGGRLLKRMGAIRANNADRERLRRAVTGAGLILAASFGLAVVAALDLIDIAVSERAMGVVLGAVLVFVGNALPKTLEPVSSTRCAQTKQTLHRFAGWTFVLAGLAYAAAWVILPVESAGIASTLVGAVGVLLVGGRTAWVLLTRRDPQQPAASEF